VAESKTELLEQLTVAQLKELASENDVELEGSVKDEHIEQLAKSRKVTKDAVQAKVDSGSSNAYADAGADPETGRASTPSDPGNTGGKGTPTADEADAASPTGGANVAGSPQATLNQAPPMTDESGSNIPFANLRQPLAEGADPTAGAAKVTPDSLDPALTDPEGTAIARVEGRTSDANLRKADGPQIDEVPPDITEGVKPSDGGPERYPFPQGGDVDVATVDPGSGAGEYYPNLEVDDWVVLDGSHELVPDRLDGRRAAVLDAPRYLVPFDKKDEVWITVRTRDEANATLQIPLAAVKEVQKGGLALTHRG
jgi:hypothetical protein